VRLLRFTPLRSALRIELGSGARVEGRVWCPGKGLVRIGRRVRLIGHRAAIELRAYEGGELVLEDDVLIEDGVSIEATRLVRIGARTRIGPFCKIIDNHFHPTTGNRHERPEPVPVMVGSDAVLGARAVLLPGASVGDGASVGPAAVLSFALPDGREFPGPTCAPAGTSGAAA
jgi:acetyltransferase-like isoleucine patch superfamily enzyme